jgi:hypothetical protein
VSKQTKTRLPPELVNEINISWGKREEFVLPCSCEVVAVEVALGCGSYSRKLLVREGEEQSEKHGG